MTAPREAPPPLVVLRGRGWAELLSSCSGAVLLLFALLVAPRVVHELAPWPSAGALLDGAWGVYAVLALVAVVALNRWAAARRGKAEVFADRLVVG